MPKKTICQTVLLDIDIHERLSALAKRFNTTNSAIIRYGLDYALDKIENTETYEGDKK